MWLPAQPARLGAAAFTSRNARINLASDVHYVGHMSNKPSLYETEVVELSSSSLASVVGGLSDELLGRAHEAATAAARAAGGTGRAQHRLMSIEEMLLGRD